MSNKFVFDEYGNKYPALDKDEVLETIGAGGLRENVYTGNIEYNSNEIKYNYSGSKPDDAILIKLLGFGCDPKSNNLTAAEIQDYLELNEFAVYFYCVDTQLYVTNANRSYLSFVKVGIGEYKLYPNGTKKLGYYMKASEQMNNVQVCDTPEEFKQIGKQADTYYIVLDDDYTVQKAIADEYGRNIAATYLEKEYHDSSYEIDAAHVGMKHDSNTVKVDGTGIELDYDEGTTKLRVDENGVSINGEVINDTYVRKDEVSEKRQNKTFYTIFNSATGAMDEYLISSGSKSIDLLEGKTKEDIIGIAGEVELLLQGKTTTFNVPFSGLFNTGDYELTIDGIGLDNGDTFVFRIPLNVYSGTTTSSIKLGVSLSNVESYFVVGGTEYTVSAIYIKKLRIYYS